MKHIDDLPDLPVEGAPVPLPPGCSDLGSMREEISVPSIYVESDTDLLLEREAMRLGTKYRSDGYRMYLQGKTPDEIATGLAVEGVTADTVLLWAKQGEWAQRLRSKNDAREKLVKENIRRIRLSKAEEDVESSLRIGKRIREVVEMKLENPKDLKTQDIKNLADAGKASSDTSARGMGEATSDDVAVGKGGGKTPLVMIFPGGGLPPMPKDVEVINVKGT